MITITKQNDGVLFTFQDSDKYLYGNGSILVPFNTLSIVADESDMITLKKAASNDVFLSARYDTDLGYRSKDDAIDDLKDLLFAETGGGGSESGITSGEVQTMIDNSLEDYYTDDEVDAALSGKASVSAVTAVANDVQTVSGQVQTKVATSDFNTYSAATATAIGNKQDALEYYSENTEEGWADIYVRNDDGEGNVDEYSFNIGGGSADLYNYNQYDDGQGNSGYSSTQIQLVNPEINLISESEENGETESTYLTVYPTGVTINNENVATEPYVDDVISGKVDTSAITTAITSGSTDSEIPTAKATYDAIQAGGGGGATYSAGTNISIDTANTINCTLNLRNGTGLNSIAGVQGEAKGKYNFAFGENSTAGTSRLDDYAFAFGYSCKARKGRSFAYGANNDVKEIDSAAFGHMITLNAPRSFSTGYHNTTNNWTNIALGEELTTNNRPEFATGTYNNSVTGSTTSGQTLFSVGNGTSSARHNAFEIRQNGDIYVNDGTNDVRLQDTILALGGLKFVQCTQAEYDAMVSGGTVDSLTIYFISNVVS